MRLSLRKRARFLIVPGAFAGQCAAQQIELFEAARVGDVAKLRALAAGKAWVNVRGPHDRTALHEAAANCQLPAVQEQQPWSLQSAAAHRALDVSCLSGDAVTTRLLLEHGADPNLRNKGGSTPLHDAASFDRLDAVKALVQHGADISLKNREGFTTLQLAARNDVSTFLGAIHQ
jgi:ankyrin repeat protein